MNKYDVKFEQAGMVDIVGDHEKQMEIELVNMNFIDVLVDIWTFYIRPANELIDGKKPWELAKTDIEATKSVLNYCFQNLVSISKLIMPFMPETSERIKTQLDSLKPEQLFPKIEK